LDQQSLHLTAMHQLVRILCLWVVLVLAKSLDLPHSYHFEPSNKSFVADYISLPANARSMSLTFLTDPPNEAFKSHSQEYKQDMAVILFLKDKENGYFVDLAANHWEHLSNTYALETFNKWKGVCIEPHPMYLEGLLSNRKCKIFTCAVGASDNEVVKFRFSKGAQGVFGGVVAEGMDNQGSEADDKEVASVTLTTLLDFAGAPAVMDYLSLDVEGAEFQVVKGLDHSKYTFHIVTVERPKQNTHHALARAGYRFVYQMTTFGECIYLHRSIPNYNELMKQYRQKTVPGWHNARNGYLLHPAWDQEHMKEHNSEHR